VELPGLSLVSPAVDVILDDGLAVEYVELVSGNVLEASAVVLFGGVELEAEADGVAVLPAEEPAPARMEN
jgi:hypothetical protein